MDKIITVLLLMIVNTWAVIIPSDLLTKTDSIFNDTSTPGQISFTRIIKDRSTNYYAATIKTIPFGIREIRTLIEDVSNYEKVNSFIKESKQVRSDSGITSYNIIMKLGFVRSWFVCKIDSIKISSDSAFAIFASKNDDRAANELVRRNEHGIFTIEYYSFSICWKLMAIDSNRTRAALISLVNPKVWLPEWVVKVTSGVIYPSMLRDFETFLASRTEAPYEPESTIKKADSAATEIVREKE